jgi:hypothetical protein
MSLPGRQILTLFLLVMLVACGGNDRRDPPDGDGDPGGPSNVPSRFASTYTALESRLEAFNGFLDTVPGRRSSVTFGAELTTANTHRGAELLTEATYQGNIVLLDRLRSLGVGGVSVVMAYPVMNDDFPRSAEYWAFYSRLARDIRSRGLKLHVKGGPIFNEKEFSNVPTDYRNVTLESYFRDRRRIAQRIAAEIRPDYLSIANEPVAEGQIFGFTITADAYVAFVNDTLAGMNRSGVQVGAGAGTWDSTEYIQRFVRDTSIDYIDLHIYPIAGPTADYLRRAVEMADIALNGGKRLIIGEAWLYKAQPAELVASPTLPAVFARDVFAFWSPLDVRFLQVIAKMASLKQIEYVSPFWTRYFFAYLDHTAAVANAAPGQLITMADQAAARQIGNGSFSPTGTAYREIISQYR